MKLLGLPAALAFVLYVASAVAHEAGHGPVRGKTAYSTQMHIHGSFSEGRGSITGGTREALNTGVDVLWWSDHAFGFHRNKTVRNFAFEDWWEYEWENEDWTPSTATIDKTKYWQLATDAGMTTYEATFSSEQAAQGARSLRIDASSDQAQFAHLFYRFDTDRDAVNRARTLAAGTTIELSVFPELVSADATAVITIELSRHRENPVVDLMLHYYLDNDPKATPYEDSGNYYVPLSYTANAWNNYVLDLTADAIAGFPDLPGQDNNAFAIKIGARARSGGRTVVFFDAYRLAYEAGYPEIYTRQRDLLDTVAARVPGVVQHQGMELHVGAHLNELSVHTEPPAFNGPIGTAVAAVHARNGLVSYNHMFGAGTCTSSGEDPQQVLAELLLANVYNADLLEVGYRCRSGRQLADFLWVWDQLTRAQRYLVGTGVSDDHNLAPGSNASRENNFVSWIYAASPDKADLLNGMRAGRLYFGDISLFDGHIELATPAGFAMGSIVITDLATAEVRIDIDGLEPGDEIRSVWGGTPANTYTSTGADFSVVEKLPVGEHSFVRVEVYSAAGVAKAFSNPLHFARRVPGPGADPFKAAVELSGVVSRSIESFRLNHASVRGDARQTLLNLSGSGEQGSLVFDWTRPERPYAVRFAGLTGNWSFDGGELALTDLDGTGTITVMAASQDRQQP